MPSNRSVVARNVQRWRNVRGVSLPDLAQQIDVPVAILANWESGKDTLPIAILFDIIKVLQVDIQQIFEPSPED